MKAYLQHIVTDLKNFSKSLDTKSILVDKPWALIDSDFEVQKLIFKKNNELILSKDGQVVIGSWDYLPEARSILIDRGKDKILCNEAFINGAVMILKMDGTKDNFFILANENIIPDLDAYKYLKKLRYMNLNIITGKLPDGNTLEVIRNIGESEIKVGNKVTIEADEINDGIYKIENTVVKYLIKNSRILEIIYEVPYKTKDGIEIMVEQKSRDYYKKGENVWINNSKAPDGRYKIVNSNNMVVKDGKILKASLFT